MCGTTSRFGACHSGSSGGERLGIRHVERGAGDLPADAAPPRARTASTIGPRAVLIRIARRLHQRESARPRSGCASPASAGSGSRRSPSAEQVLEVALVRASRCEHLHPEAGGAPRDRLPDPAEPDDPERRAGDGRAEELPGLPGHPLALWRTRRSPPGSGAPPPSAARTSRSAVASVSASGVLPTGMPRAAVAATIDVVVADRVVGDHAQLRRRRDQLGVDPLGEQRQQPVADQRRARRTRIRRWERLRPHLDSWLEPSRASAGPGSSRVTNMRAMPRALSLAGAPDAGARGYAPSAAIACRRAPRSEPWATRPPRSRAPTAANAAAIQNASTNPSLSAVCTATAR